MILRQRLNFAGIWLNGSEGGSRLEWRGSIPVPLRREIAGGSVHVTKDLLTEIDVG